MGKRGRSQKKENKNPKRRTQDKDVHPEDMDDEIDAFHKQRDVIPLDVNGEAGESDEDIEQPVFDVENFSDDEDDDDDVDDDTQLTGLAAKIARQQKFLRAKIGGVEDEMHEEDEEDEEEKKTVWGRRKSDYYSADNVDYELQSSDEELPAEEEAEVMRLQREKAKFLSMEDFGIEDVDQDSDEEPTMEEIMVKGKTTSKSPADEEAKDDTGTAYEEVKKDLNALSKEEQMDVVYSSAPELVGLLSELNDALEQLEGKVNPLLAKVKGQNTKGGMHYLEVKQILLLAYCQAISFYLLLKSEGQPVRDHPVIARLVEIKSLLDKMKQLDENLPADLEEFLDKSHEAETKEMLVREASKLASDSFTKDHELAQKQEIVMHKNAAKLVKVDEMRENKEGKSKRQNDQVGLQRMEMLKVRAALEDKLKQKGVFSSITPKPDRAQKRLQPVNRQLETLDDFDDDAMDVEGRTGRLANGQASSLPPSKLSHLVSANVKKPKIVSGDDDLPKRDDIGERRRKHELRVLAGAGIEPMDDDEDGIGTVGIDKDADMDDNDSGTEESEDEFYKQVKQQRAAKLAAKEEIYSRTSAGQALAEPEMLVDGKRQISYQMEKNKGLTRARKKLTKNPRKKYKLKHQKAVVRRKGQVRDIRKPTGPYGGETTGINVGITRSIRFNS